MCFLGRLQYRAGHEIPVFLPNGDRRRRQHPHCVRERVSPRCGGVDTSQLRRLLVSSRPHRYRP